MLQLSKDDLVLAYTRMRTIREFEDRVHKEFANRKIPGSVHLYAGEEASAVGVCINLSNEDYIASTHRGHGHCIAKGCDVEAMMKEIYGRRDGLCSGKGGSMHIADLSKGMMGANGIVGGGPPLICGAALSAKILGTGGVAVAFVGDGGSNQGTTFESYNLAKIWNLPAIFVVEDNGYAEATASTWSIGGSQVKRAEGFGMPGVEVNGHDFFAVYKAAKEAIDRARVGNGPSLIHARLDRYYGHVEGDAQTYRAKGEQDQLRANTDTDCLKIFRQRVIETSLLEAKELDNIDHEIASLINHVVATSESALPPSPDDLLTNVYVSY